MIPSKAEEDSSLGSRARLERSDEAAAPSKRTIYFIRRVLTGIEALSVSPSCISIVTYFKRRINDTRA
jgi:hypothetical protein